MPKKGKSKKSGGGGLGTNLIRTRFDGRRSHGNAKDVSLLHTSDLNDGYEWGRLGGLSVTEQGDLDDFLATAELAGTEFTAEKLNVTMVTEFTNEAVLTDDQRDAKRAAEAKHRHKIRVPRRPPWTKTMSAELLQANERESFLQWRRTLSQLAEIDDLLLTPFERNLDFWRQLWRVIERSDVVVQIVDARDPLLFRCEDLDVYVKEVDPEKRVLMLINKADLLSDRQRSQWAEYLVEQDVPFVFFSAVIESEKNKAEAQAAKQALLNQPTEALPFALEIPGLPLSKAATAKGTTEEIGEKREEEEEEAKRDEEGGGEGGGGVEVKETKEVVVEEGTKVTEEETESTGGASTTTEAGLARGSEAAATGAAAAEANGKEEAGQSPYWASAASSTTAPPGFGGRPTDYMYDCEALLDLFAELATAGRRKKKEKDGGDGGDIDTADTPTTTNIIMPVIGLVGYPNVGKSSTINALCRKKAVSVSATPGKTKHFQTLILGDIQLCDCPGLVFPNFANTKAQLVCNGILPIDQLRDVIPPSTYVVQHIPRHVLEQTYGINIIKPAADDPFPDRPPTAAEFLNAYSFARGFMNARGAPDISRGARYILKDFVKGKLLFCKAPPGFTQLVSLAPGVAGDEMQAFHETRSVDSAFLSGPRHNPTYANEVDDEFFAAKAVIVTKGANGINDFRKAKTRAALREAAGMTGKKHHKKKKEKGRRANPGKYH